MNMLGLLSKRTIQARTWQQRRSRLTVCGGKRAQVLLFLLIGLMVWYFLLRQGPLPQVHFNGVTPCQVPKVEEVKPAVVSVVVPYTCSKAVYVDQTLSSLAAQRMFPASEIIFVMSKSTYHTCAESLKDAAHRNVNIRFATSPDALSAPAARNFGAAAADTDYLLFIDSDDLMDVTAVEKMLFCLLFSPSHVSLCAGRTMFFYEDGRIMNYGSPGFDASNRFLHFNFGNINHLVRKEHFLAVGGNDQALWRGLEDWDFFLRLANSSLWGITIHEPLSWYRQRNRSPGEWPALENERSERETLRKKYSQLWRGEKSWPSVSMKKRHSLHEEYCFSRKTLDVALPQLYKDAKSSSAGDDQGPVSWGEELIVSSQLALLVQRPSEKHGVIFLSRDTSADSLRQAVHECDAVRSLGTNQTFLFVSLAAYEETWLSVSTIRNSVHRSREASLLAKLRQCTNDVHFVDLFLSNGPDIASYLVYLSVSRSIAEVRTSDASVVKVGSVLNSIASLALAMDIDEYRSGVDLKSRNGAFVVKLNNSLRSSSERATFFRSNYARHFRIMQEFSRGYLTNSVELRAEEGYSANHVVDCTY
uniref:Glycosyltransferase 2-like domain-containing protein n=1 Tax=Palpitomonas bilix TaxID=652834 RepID=A0A7S3G0Z0_9EUKA|mmetsp:Transcript_16871/g.42347  ORF Transcript_16871/g.42347 Transcript_16871/m.42347 type:complete len:588 (+) Transcript_16871:138-1901(+)